MNERFPRPLRLIGSLLVAVAAGCRSEAERRELSPVKVESPGAGTVYWQVGNFYIAGQPTLAGLEAAKARGVRTVLNLRPADEQKDFDEKKAVEGLGLAYVNIPVTSRSLDDAKVEEFLAAAKGARKPLLIHCASANRASALWAAYLGINYGLPSGDAIELAAESGLKSQDLRAFVKDYLERKQQERAAAPAKAAVESPASR